MQPILATQIRWIGRKKQEIYRSMVVWDFVDTHTSLTCLNTGTLSPQGMDLDHMHRFPLLLGMKKDILNQSDSFNCKQTNQVRSLR